MTIIPMITMADDHLYVYVPNAENRIWLFTEISEVYFFVVFVCNFIRLSFDYWEAIWEFVLNGSLKMECSMAHLDARVYELSFLDPWDLIDIHYNAARILI